MSSAHSSTISSLVASLVPASRGDNLLNNELVAHCEEILNRHVLSVTPVSPIHDHLCSHIGQNHEEDLGHLSELVKRRCAYV
jgi:gamma-tubulin complex component 3